MSLSIFNVILQHAEEGQCVSVKLVLKLNDVVWKMGTIIMLSSELSTLVCVVRIKWDYNIKYLPQCLAHSNSNLITDSQDYYL